MHVYRGLNRRQVGGSIWSTVARGAKPYFLQLLKKLGKKAAGSAMRVGADLIRNPKGDLKEQLKSSLHDEFNHAKEGAVTKMNELKRCASDAIQSGSGYKRRRISNEVKSIKRRSKQKTMAIRSKQNKRKNINRRIKKRKVIKKRGKKSNNSRQRSAKQKNKKITRVNKLFKNIVI